MKEIRWDIHKNERLKLERNISFEQILPHLRAEDAVIEMNPSQRHKGQEMFVVKIKDYVYLIPFVESESEIFLKTIIPSRKWTKKYGEGGVRA